jgi:Tfp pilus assembly protein PilX
MKAALIILLVVVVVVGLLLTLRTTRNAGAPSRETIERAKERTRAQEADDKDD